MAAAERLYHPIQNTLDSSAGAPQGPRTPEIIPPHEIGIYDENERLRRAVIWGPVGAEALVVQLYPSSLSLFYDEMNVPGARQEAMDFENRLTARGVDVKMARDVLARSLPIDDSLSKAEVTTQIVQKALQISQQYGKPLPDKFYEDLVSLINSDCLRYGEYRGLALNKTLILDPEMPLGNMIYARDQMNVILSTRFVSRMREPVRQKEVPLYEDIYAGIGIGPGTEMPEGETFEGGDAYVHNGVIYVGVGIRTTRGAAEFIYETLKNNDQLQHYQFAIVEDTILAKLSGEEREEYIKSKQRYMHLDTFSNPISETQIVVCDEEAKIREVQLLNTDPATGRPRVYHREPFLSFLEERHDDNGVIRVDEDSQEEFGCNFLALDETTIFFPDTRSAKTDKIKQQLRDAGKIVIEVPLYESTRGYGASHCMTGQLRRKN